MSIRKGCSLIILISLLVSNQMVFQGYNLIAISLTELIVVWLFFKWLFRPLDKIQAQVSRLSTGDLTSTIDETQNNEFGRLAVALNNMVRYLRETLDQMQAASKKLSCSTVDLANNAYEDNKALEVISSSSGEIAMGSQDIGRMAKDAACRTNELSSLAQAAADNMKTLLRNADSISIAAQTGQIAIDEAAATITKIAATTNENAKLAEHLTIKSHQVEKIVSIIDDIAQQTNLLALNAAIEAARAGEQGCGFAVVAEEVRILAEKSREATKQIGMIVNEMLSDIGKVVEVFGDTSHLMEEGVNTISQANSSFGDITRQINITRESAQEVSRLTGVQSNASSALLEAVSRVAAVAQESVAATEATAVSAQQVNSSMEKTAKETRDMSRLAAGLQEGITRFKLRDKNIIRAGLFLSDKSVPYAGMQKFAELLDKRTKGRYELQIFHSGQLGDTPQIAKRVKDGTLEITCLSSTVISATAKELMILELPFLFKNEQGVDKIVNGPFARRLLDIVKNYGFYGLAFIDEGFRIITNSSREVRKLEDLHGLKIRVAPAEITPLHLQTIKCLGAEPIPLSFNDTYSALRKKEIDGQESPIITSQSSNFFNVQKHLAFTNHIYTPFIIVYSLELWNKLAAEERILFEQIAKESAQYATEVTRNRTRELVASLAKNGLVISHMLDDELIKMRKAVQPVYDNFKGKSGAKFLDELLAEIGK